MVRIKKALIIFLMTIAIVPFMIIAIVLFSGCESTSLEETNQQEEQAEIIEVTDKYIKRYDNRDLYMIATENEVFKIEDNILIGKFNSSDIYSKIKIGKKYKIETTGVRSRFMSWYRNINKIELVEEEN